MRSDIKLEQSYQTLKNFVPKFMFAYQNRNVQSGIQKERKESLWGILKTQKDTEST